MVLSRVLAGLALVPCVMSQQQPTQRGVTIPEDLACLKGPHASAWGAVKQRFRDLLEGSPGIFEVIPSSSIQNAVNAAISDVKAVGGFSKTAGDECGYGRLALQLLSVAALEEPSALAQPIQDTEVISNPTLTLLLDIPWVATALSGWPFFGILAQIGLHKAEKLGGLLDYDAVDQLAKPATRDFFAEVQNASQRSDLMAMAEASYKVLQAPSLSEQLGIMGSLTAMATQSAIQPDVQKRMGTCESLQQAMRTAIGDAAELELALTSRWPLWSLLHITVDAFSVAPTPAGSATV